MRKVMSELASISEQSYYVWKNKSHVKLINLIEKYFTEKELKEFIETGKIKNFEKNNEIEKNEIEENILINAIVKLNNKPGKYLPTAKNIENEEFKNAILNSHATNKKEFFEYLDTLQSKNKPKMWMDYTKKYLDQNFSNIEIKLMCQNSTFTLNKLSI